VLSAVENIDIGGQALLQKDEDIIILGDFNTMGDGRQGSAEEEIENLEAICQLESPGFLHLGIQPRCTEYYRGHGGWLDHILVSRFMEEITDFTAYVKGYCKIKSCADISGTMPAAYIKLSDHCPVMFVINDVDNDD
jgi:predicted extracellular nuclease